MKEPQTYLFSGKKKKHPSNSSCSQYQSIHLVSNNFSIQAYFYLTITYYFTLKWEGDVFLWKPERSNKLNILLRNYLRTENINSSSFFSYILIGSAKLQKLKPKYFSWLNAVQFSQHYVNWTSTFSTSFLCCIMFS